MTVKHFIGMKLENATAAAKRAGFEVSVENSNGPQRLNCDYRQGRVNLRVDNGVVVDAYIG